LAASGAADIWQLGRARNIKRSPEVATPESVAEVMKSRLIILFWHQSKPGGITKSG